MSDTRTINTPAGPATLRRSDRRTLAISVLPDGTLELIAPLDARESDLSAKVRKRLRWIVRQRTTFADMNRNRVSLRYESGATHTYLGRQYRLKVSKGATPGVRLVGGFFQVAAKTGTTSEVAKLLNGWLREKADHQFRLRLAKWERWCSHRKLPAPRARLLKMPKRWGSAGSGGRIALNPELVRKPSACIDYVITHEICHLKHPRHSRAFFILLDQLLPNWRAIKARLEQQ